MSSRQAELLGRATFLLICASATVAAAYFMPVFAGGVAVGFGVAILRDRVKRYDETDAESIEDVDKRIDRRYS